MPLTTAQHFSTIFLAIPRGKWSAIRHALAAWHFATIPGQPAANRPKTVTTRYSESSRSTTQVFLMVATKCCRPSITRGRMSPPMSTSMMSTATHGELAGVQPHAHVANARQSARLFHGGGHLGLVVAEHHAGDLVAGLNTIGLDAARLGLVGVAHGSVVNQIHSACAEARVGLGLTQPSVDGRHICHGRSFLSGNAQPRTGTHGTSP